MSDNDAVPLPGSDEAVTAGCRCPVKPNKRGKGFRRKGEHSYWIALSCPVHRLPTPSTDTETDNG